MNIGVGSTNIIKIGAVKEVIGDYPSLRDAAIIGKAESGVADQPFSVEEVITGAQNRARAAFQGCDLGIGIESGFMRIPHAKTGFIELTVAAVFDGSQFHLGIGPCFECPPKVMQIMHEKKCNLSQACFTAGISSHPSIGEDVGIIGLLTNGRKTRKEYTKDALMMALIAVEKKQWYA